MGEPTTFSEMYKLLTETLQKQTESLTKQIQSSETNVKNKIQNANIQIEKVQKNQIFLERRARRNNILFFGFKVENQSNLINDTLSKLNELFSLNIKTSDINNLHKVGKTDTAPILIEFVSYLKKTELFKNPEKLRSLKGTGYAISNDLCEEDRKEMKILQKHLKKAKEENKDAKIKGLKLEINNQLYTAEQLEQSESQSDSSDSYDSDTTDDDKTEVKSLKTVIKSNEKNKKRKKKKIPSPAGGVKTRAHKKKRLKRLLLFMFSI